jgi:hypothetical protein
MVTLRLEGIWHLRRSRFLARRKSPPKCARARVPSHAVLLGAFAIGFAFSGAFDVLTDLIVFMLLLFNGLAVASVYVLRRTLPDAVRPYRVWGYPVVPMLFLLATVYLMTTRFSQHRDERSLVSASSRSGCHFTRTMLGATVKSPGGLPRCKGHRPHA